METTYKVEKYESPAIEYQKEEISKAYQSKTKFERGYLIGTLINVKSGINKIQKPQSSKLETSVSKEKDSFRGFFRK